MKRPQHVVQTTRTDSQSVHIHLYANARKNGPGADETMPVGIVVVRREQALTHTTVPDRGVEEAQHRPAELRFTLAGVGASTSLTFEDWNELRQTCDRAWELWHEAFEGGKAPLVVERPVPSASAILSGAEAGPSPLVRRELVASWLRHLSRALSPMNVERRRLEEAADLLESGEPDRQGPWHFSGAGR